MTEEIQVDGDKLAGAIRRVSPFMATNVQSLSGIFFESSQGTLQLTATDGYQLAHLSIELPFIEGSLLLDGAGCKDFADRHYTGQEVQVQAGEDVVVMGAVSIDVVHAEYPDYNKFKPEPDTSTMITAKDWIKSIRKQNQANSSKNPIIGIVYDQVCKMYFAKDGVTTSCEEMPIQLFVGVPKRVAYNAEQFRRALTSCGSGVTITVGLPEKATIFEGDDYWQLLMPYKDFPLTTFLTEQEKEELTWFEEALKSVRRGEAPGKVIIGGGKCYLEISADRTETEIIMEEPKLAD